MAIERRDHVARGKPNNIRKMASNSPAVAAVRSRLVPNFWDGLAFTLVFGAFVLVLHGGRETLAPLSLQQSAISLDPSVLPEYALRTTLRMLTAIIASLVFTFIYGALAAKSRRLELVLVPLLDILQSVPVLGFLSITVVGFMALFPGRVLGVELAAIFAIFTEFGVEHDLQLLPVAEDRSARPRRGLAQFPVFGLAAFLASRGALRYARSRLEHHDVHVGWLVLRRRLRSDYGRQHHDRPAGYRLLCCTRHQGPEPRRNWLGGSRHAVGDYPYDQLLFRPLVAWSDKFRVELSASGTAPHSWLLAAIRQTRLLGVILQSVGKLLARLPRQRLALPDITLSRIRELSASPWADRAWMAIVLSAAAYSLWSIANFVATELDWTEVGHALLLGFITLLRVIVLIALATLIWVPVGVWIGLRPRVAERVQPLAQFLAAFPANIIFPFVVATIVRFRLNPDIWLSPLMVLGTQWYILFNVIAGASAFPNDLKEAAASFRIRGWRWWRQVILPGIFPYYVTGAITASGGSWNASIVAETANWGSTTLIADGLGAYIAQATAAGDYPRIVLGVAVMSLFVVAFNRALWRPLFDFAARRLRLD